MDMSMVLILGIVVCLNFMITLIKFTLLKNKKKAIVDVIIFLAILWVCKGSTAMISIGMVASLLVSIVLFFPVFGKSKPKEDTIQNGYVKL